MVPDFLPQLIALITALTVGVPTADLPELPDRFASAAVNEATRPLRTALSELENAGAIPPETASEIRGQINDVSIVSRAVIAASVRTPITVRAVPQLIHEDLAEGKSLSVALDEAGHDVGAAVRKGNREIVAALREVTRSPAEMINARDGSAGAAQVAKVTVRGWDPKAVRAAVKQERAELRAAVKEQRAEFRKAAKKARAAVRNALGNSAN